MTDEHPDHANVIALPPLVYLAFFALGVGLNYVWSLALLANGPRYPVGFALVASGVLLIARAMVQFRQAGTHIEPYKPTTALVTDGVFRWSRNPIYLALSLIYVGIGVIANNGWTLILLVPVLIIMRYGVIAPGGMLLGVQVWGDIPPLQGHRAPLALKDMSQASPPERGVTAHIWWV